MNQPGITEFVVVWFARGEFLAIRDDGRVIGRGGSIDEAVGAAMRFMGASEADFDSCLLAGARYVPERTPKG
jgi:ADP-ribosylglycohydrolase